MDAVMLVAPTEPRSLRDVGKVSLTPERKGVDVLFAQQPLGLIGVQRKEFPGDFLASIHDGRLSKEVAQMQSLDLAVLVLEGRGQWTTEGELINRFGPPWTKTSHRRYLCTVRSANVWVEQTDNLSETMAFIRDLKEWAGKPRHHSLKSRPAAKRNGWGRITNRDYQIHFVQGLPDVGPELAERIIDTLGMPFQLRVGEQELQRVRGIGKRLAKRIVRAFEEEE